ncbi:MAG: IS30 family transposase [Lachnospiraceae bacterium]|nr:IS30 family transposase [Lachnospiraceae bacterium]
MGKSLTFVERVKIETLLGQGLKPYKIAEILGRSKQTIYNEIKRGSVKQRNTYFIEYEKYLADAGERVKHENYSRCGVDLKIGNNVELLEFIGNVVKKNHFSFYSALQWIAKNTDRKVELTEQTLYNYLEKGLFLNLTYKDLPEGRRKKNKKKNEKRPAWKNIESRKIEERPEEAEGRMEFGHWEGDTVYSGSGTGSKTCLLVLTERKTRFEIIQKIKDRSADSVINAFKKISKTYKVDIKTITFDNGSEFSDWRKIEKLINCKIYFCHPYRSGERGSNEFNNRIIRRWIPKGSDIGNYTKSQIQKIMEWMNNMPRRILLGNTPKKCYENIKCLKLLTN